MNKISKNQTMTMWDIMAEDAKYEKNVVVIPRQLDLPIGGERPVFNHDRLNELYNYGLNIPDGLLSEIISLPKETLAGDLVKIIHDSCLRYNELSDEFTNAHNGWLALHALYVAREIKAEECLEPALDFLSQDEAFLDYWLGDSITETMWSVIAACGVNQLDKLAAFMKEPGRLTWSKVAVAEAVNQLAFQKQISTELAVNWLREVIEYHTGPGAEVENLADTNLNGSLVGIYLDLKAHELTPLVKKMFNQRLVPLSYAGDWQDVQHEMKSPLNKNWGVKKQESIYETYNVYRHAARQREEELELLEDNDDFMDDDDDYYLPPEPYVRTEPKTGRNDPCPCGSGKKYKKCHGPSAGG